MANFPLDEDTYEWMTSSDLFSTLLFCGDYLINSTDNDDEQQQQQQSPCPSTSGFKRKLEQTDDSSTNDYDADDQSFKSSKKLKLDGNTKSSMQNNYLASMALSDALQRDVCRADESTADAYVATAGPPHHNKSGASPSSSPKYHQRGQNLSLPDDRFNRETPAHGSGFKKGNKRLRMMKRSNSSDLITTLNASESITSAPLMNQTALPSSYIK